MENTTNIKIPKRYEKMLQSVDHDSDGYWGYSEYGYYFREMGSQCHTAHEDTQKDLLRVIRSLTPCDCDDCRNELAKRENAK